MHEEEVLPDQGQLELSEVKKKLNDIFVYYAQFGERLNTSTLKSSIYHRMLKEAKIVQDHSDGFNKKRADIIFCMVTKNRGAMTFDIFL